MSHASELDKIFKKFFKESGREKDKKGSPGAFLGGEDNLQKERTGINTLIPGNRGTKKGNQSKTKKGLNL